MYFDIRELSGQIRRLLRNGFDSDDVNGRITVPNVTDHRADVSPDVDEYS